MRGENEKQRKAGREHVLQHQPLLQRHGRGPVEGVARANGDVQEPLALLRQPVVGRVQHAVMHEEAERLERRADVPVGAPVVPGEQARHVLRPFFG